MVTLWHFEAPDMFQQFSLRLPIHILLIAKFSVSMGHLKFRSPQSAHYLTLEVSSFHPTHKILLLTLLNKFPQI